MSNLTLIHEPPMSLGVELWLNAHSLSRASLLNLVRQHAISDRHFSVQFSPRFCDQHPLNLFKKYGKLIVRMAYKTSRVENDACVLKISNKTDEGYVAIVPSDSSDIWLLFTDMKPSSDEYRKLFSRITNLVSSKLVGAWVSNEEVRNFMEVFQERMHSKITPGRVTHKGRDRSTVEYLRGRTSLEEIFDELDESRSVLRSMDFKVGEPGKKPVLSGGISKWLALTYRSGDISTFDNFLIRPIELLLRNRVSSLNEGYDDWRSGKPIFFKFWKNVLVNRENNLELIKVLGQLPQVSVCTFHANPYLHVTVVDLYDGSTLDLFADDPETLSVMPSERCSVAAMSRILEQIYNNFAAGSIETEAARN
ncbi:MAG: hypothetical protein ACYC5A_09550 [Thermoleophilia bacterium]